MYALFIRWLICIAAIVVGTSGHRQGPGKQQAAGQSAANSTKQIELKTVVVIFADDPITCRHVQNELKRLGIREYPGPFDAGVMDFSVPVEDYAVAYRVLRSDAAHADYRMFFDFKDDFNSYDKTRKRPWKEIASGQTAAALAGPLSTLKPCALRKAIEWGIKHHAFPAEAKTQSIRYAARPYVDDNLEWGIGYDVEVTFTDDVRTEMPPVGADRSFTFVVFDDGKAEYVCREPLW